GRVVDGDLRPVLVVERGGDPALARDEDDLLEIARIPLDVLNELVVGLLLRVVVLRDQRLARQPDEQDDHDEREEGAAEKAIHVSSQGTRGWIPVVMGLTCPKPERPTLLRASGRRAVPPHRGDFGSARRSRARSRSL